MGDKNFFRKRLFTNWLQEMVRIILFEDNRDFADGFAEIISDATGMELVGAFENCKNAVQNVRHLQPDVILMDIDMPVKNGLEGLRNIRGENITTPILMLTVFDDNDNIFQAICDGATGYLLKKTSPEKMLEYINEAYEGGAPMTPAIARKVLTLFSQPYQHKKEFHSLTAREQGVLTLLVRGFSYKMIAAELMIGMETVRSHIKSIYSKLHVNSKSEAVAAALHNKLA
jgi:DNA-binding NarL/FixJ family response regulator